MKLVNMNGNKKTGKLLFETGILIMIATLLGTVGIWQSILTQWKVSQGGELFFQAFIQSGGKYVITYLNQESLYISFLSVLFSFLGNKEELVLVINLILQLAGILFFYLASKKLFYFVFPLAVAIISGVLSGCFYPVIMDSSMHLVWFLSGLLFWIGAVLYRNLSGRYLKYILIGIILGVASYVDIAGVFLLIAFMFFILISGAYTLKERFLQLLCFLLCIINGFFVMFYLWNNLLFSKALFNQWLYNKLSFCMTENGLNQYISLGVILFISVIFFIIKRPQKITSAVKEETVIAEESVIAEKVKKETEEPKEAEENEKTEEPKISTPVKLIDNPLPVPKKHVKKEMKYAFEPTPDQMHYDLNNYSVDDDYDLKDI